MRPLAATPKSPPPHAQREEHFTDIMQKNLVGTPVHLQLQEQAADGMQNNLAGAFKEE